MADSVQIQSMSHRHKAMADWLLAHPNEKNLELMSKHFNVSRSWLSIVMNSDVFKEYFEQRRREWEQVMMKDIGACQLDVTKKAYERLSDILCDDETDPRLVLDIAHKTHERLFGKVAASTAQVKEEKVQEISRPVDAGTLGQAREIYRRTVTTTQEVPLAQLPAPG
jgi:hypothetical protein